MLTEAQDLLPQAGSACTGKDDEGNVVGDGHVEHGHAGSSPPVP